MDSAILALTFGLGMLHALDADHIAAVANLAGNGPSRRHALLAGGLWALGHGLSLLLFGTAVLLLGMAIPEHFSALAEHLIALVLIGIGLWVFWDLYRRRVHLHFHTHDGLLQHGHLHAHPRNGADHGFDPRGAHEGRLYDYRDHRRDPHAHDHGALLVGGLHGSAHACSTVAEAEPEGWEARLALRFEQRAGRTVLTHRSHEGPLAVQKPFYPEGDVCHVYLLHPPGGVVGGDRLAIEIEVASDAHAVITTPAAGKFYRSAGPASIQEQLLSVAPGAALEWLPQETILYAQCRASPSTRVTLAPGSSAGRSCASAAPPRVIASTPASAGNASSSGAKTARS